MASTDVPEDDEAWLYGEAEKKDGREKPEGEGGEGEDFSEAQTESETAPVVPDSKLSADAPPFVPEGKDDISAEDKEAGEVSGEDVENQDEDEDSDDDDVQVVIGDIKTQPTYEKFKSTYTRTTQQLLSKQASKGVDLDAPGTINGVSVYEYDLNSLDVDEKPWRKPGADITDYFNYGFNEDTWMKYCEKQKRLRSENGTSRMFMHHTPLPPSSRPAALEKPDPTSQSPSYRAGAAPTTPTSQTNLSSPTDRRAGPPPGRKMCGAIDVIGGTQRDSRRPKNQFEFDSQPTVEVPDYKKYMPVGAPGPGDLPPSHIPPPGYHGPPPPLQPPGPVPPPHMVGPPMGVPAPGGPPRFGPGDPYATAYYPPPSGPPPDRGPPGYDNRGPYGPYDNYGAPPPGYHSGPPPGQPGGWDNRGGGPSFNEWDYRRDRSPPRSDSEFSSSGEDYGDRRYRGRELYDPFERHDRPRSRDRMDRSMDRGSDRMDRGQERREDRDRRHRERSERTDRPERPERPDREKDERHRRRKEGPEGEHRSKHKKSKRSKREREEEPMETAPAAAPPVAT